MINYYYKKAAMFGLDARIALAIFGALSVISGAALYSAMQNTGATANITILREFEKSLEAYYLDMGSLPDRSSVELDLEMLIENPGSAYWKGPYVIPSADTVVGKTVRIKLFNMDVDISGIIKGSRVSLAQTGNTGTVNGETLYLTAVISNDKLPALVNLDKLVDDGDGFLAGKIQAYQFGNSTTQLDMSVVNTSLYYKTGFIY